MQNVQKSELELLLKTWPLFCWASVKNGLDIFMPLDLWCTKGKTIKELYQVPL